MKVFNDKSVFVSGGTGSFGNAVVEKFLKTGVREIRIFSRDEKNKRICETLRRRSIEIFLGDAISIVTNGIQN